MALIASTARTSRFRPASCSRQFDMPRRGVRAAMSSDHFSPWSERQGESGFAWSFLGAALEATNLPFGVVNAPGQRYHPAIVAQAAATLCEMFPGRLWVALGTGEASNEHITGERWPSKAERNARLLECVEVMRALFAGEVVNHDGLVRVDRAKLWTLPADPPPLIGPAVSEETAAWVGGWADGLVTVNQPREKLERMIAAFRENGGEGKRLAVQVHLSWAEDSQRCARAGPRSMAHNIFPPPLCWDSRPSSSSMCGTARATGEAQTVVVLDGSSASGGPARAGGARLRRDQLHQVGQDLHTFIDAFGRQCFRAGEGAVVGA